MTDPEALKLDEKDIIGALKILYFQAQTYKNAIENHMQSIESTIKFLGGESDGGNRK